MRKRSTQDVIDSHLKCFGERNLDGILSDYAQRPVRAASGSDQRKRIESVRVGPAQAVDMTKQ